jgi:selenocysteine lyase/cysteine desulfurase
MVQVSKEHGIPVIADCAAIFPSRQRVKELVSTGCEAILLSGGKIVGGPQASGLLLGDKDFVRLSSEISFPNDGALRSVKIDRGQLMGIAAAVRKFSQIDEKTLRDEYQTRCQLAVSVLGDLAGASVSVLPEILIEHVPMIAIKDNGALEHSFFERLSQRLLDRPQPIGVHYIRARRLICISPIGLSDETMQIVCHAVRDEWAKLIDDML